RRDLAAGLRQETGEVRHPLRVPQPDRMASVAHDPNVAFSSELTAARADRLGRSDLLAGIGESLREQERRSRAAVRLDRGLEVSVRLAATERFRHERERMFDDRDEVTTDPVDREP